MKVLVTGASGFLGQKLCQKLSGTIYKASTQNCDLTDPFSLNQFDSISFDQIYHLAAWTQAGDFCLRHPAEQWIINQKINTHILDWWQRNQPQAKLICMGTSCSYDPNLPLIEENYLKGLPIDSLFTYAMTKRMLLTGLMAMHRQYNLDYLYLIPSTLYGSGYHTDGRQLHFIFDLIKKILNGKNRSDPVVLWGDGEQKRELVHVDDFVDTMIYLVKDEKNCWLNIGAGQEFSIKEFAQNICLIAGYPFENIQFDTEKYVGARSKVLSIEKLLKTYPAFKPKFSLHQGLADTIEWFQTTFFQEAHT